MGTSTSSGAVFDPYDTPTRKPFQSLTSSMNVPAGCTSCRTESTFSMILNGEKVTVTLRDKILPEDPFLTMVRATAFAIARGGDYRGVPPGRDVRGDLVRGGAIPI